MPKLSDIVAADFEKMLKDAGVTFTQSVDGADDVTFAAIVEEVSIDDPEWDGYGDQGAVFIRALKSHFTEGIPSQNTEFKDEYFSDYRLADRPRTKPGNPIVKMLLLPAS
ncbi:hypothetical protein [Rubellicoccus peritrichatus]|uniref:Uncharacterized protein n=1 Tax=Rubellicoccus peritrichatus TaxID=3080537 RepID=A0AAQ3QXL2_9BACT|nr:hypothetical protein [Puniceicoccus sp. CR14]WOO43157.1 hypothetical protein RZN69_08630 [Puniceicoccus sp. CR14]